MIIKLLFCIDSLTNLCHKVHLFSAEVSCRIQKCEDGVGSGVRPGLIACQNHCAETSSGLYSFIAAGARRRVRLNHCAAFIFPFEFFIHFTRAAHISKGRRVRAGSLGRRVSCAWESRENSVRTRVCVAPFEIPNSPAIKRLVIATERRFQ
jgi:hypothetical protein